MKSYELLEQAILDSIIVKPELMESIKLEDKHFKKHRRLWLFLKEGYKRFGTIDIPRLAKICPNGTDLIDYVADVLESSSSYVRFNEYQNELLNLYQNYEEIEEIYKLSKKLYIRDIDINEFKKEIKGILGDD